MLTTQPTNAEVNVNAITQKESVHIRMKVSNGTTYYIYLLAFLAPDTSPKNRTLQATVPVNNMCISETYLTVDFYIIGFGTGATYNLTSFVTEKFQAGTLLDDASWIVNFNYMYYSLNSTGNFTMYYGTTTSYIDGFETQIISPNQPSLTNGYVDPTSGDISTTFNYYVTYSDPNGDAPTVRNVYIDNVAYNMEMISGNYTSGAVYEYSTTLSAGSHSYYFYFDDGHGNTVRLPTSGVYSGPNVSGPFDFTVNVNPSSCSISQGQSTSATVTVSLVSGISQSVSLAASGLPSGVSYNFNPSSGNPTFNSTFTISTQTSTPTGTYTITITGTGGGVSTYTTYTLTVTQTPDFSISSEPSSLTIQQGNSNVSTIKVTSISGFNQEVQLSANNVPSGVTVSFNPIKVIPTATSTLTISISTSAIAGEYSLTVIGTSGSLTHSTKIFLKITISITPPTADFTYSPTDVYIGDSVLLDASLTQNSCKIVSYKWTFATPTTIRDEFDVTTATFSYKFSTLDVYTITLTVVDEYNQISSKSKNVNVLKPEFTIDINPKLVLKGESSKLEVATLRNGKPYTNADVQVKLKDTPIASLHTDNYGNASFILTFTNRDVYIFDFVDLAYNIYMGKANVTSTVKPLVKVFYDAEQTYNIAKGSDFSFVGELYDPDTNNSITEFNVNAILSYQGLIIPSEVYIKSNSFTVVANTYAFFNDTVKRELDFSVSISAINYYTTSSSYKVTMLAPLIDFWLADAKGNPLPTNLIVGAKGFTIKIVKPESINITVKDVYIKLQSPTVTLTSENLQMYMSDDGIYVDYIFSDEGIYQITVGFNLPIFVPTRTYVYSVQQKNVFDYISAYSPYIFVLVFIVFAIILWKKRR